MKILCASNWNNTWIPYWTKYLESRGHKVKWLIGRKEDFEIDYDWCDVILCMWAVGWANILSKFNKPLFIIHRSYEVFNDVRGSVQDINWNNVKRLFMLNESHYELFKKQVSYIQPTFIKNGIDLDEWTLFKREHNHNIAWIANIDHKKGEMLAAHAIAELQKIDPLVQLYHIGKIQSNRIELYLNNIAPYMKSTWYSEGYRNSHKFVLDFLKNKKYIFSSSLVEGHPMNILEAMATGCKPLIHRYPGVEYQFPEKYIWTTFDDLKRIYQEPYKPEEYRQFIVNNYDYRKVYEPVARAIEEYKK